MAKADLKLYEIPTPEELQSFIIANDLTSADIEAMTGARPRTVRAWTTSSDLRGYHPIPWTAWILLNIMLDKTDKSKLLKEISKNKKTKTGRSLFERGIGGKPRKQK